MDESIQSESNRDIAKAHVDFLGAWLQKTNIIINKGVHNKMERLEAVKAVFHTYLVIADLLEYLDKSKSLKNKASINTATIDEIEVLLSIPRVTAKKIVKARVQHGSLDLNTLSNVDGIGAKTLKKAEDVFSW